MTYEIREEARRREAEQARLQAAREQLARDMRTVAETPEGGRVLSWLIEQGNLFTDDYQPGHAGAYAAGRKATALRLWKMLEHLVPPDRFLAITRRQGDSAAEDSTILD